ncbi:4'-phosphopantetheinyl transferase superfamily protein [Falsarthrobacter nasiphocae]|uniref:4'-phosphopantetheinyl transferase domain-containing protein n=1 Tax=Falsarthrobacter nasiphocae TaxID=189863 RepID=A0AAE3YI99_9MICC|nr:4'-phosphopantetheinyl transferase superfamily protein [Falsarthrobacter nasiphocae]MDR6892700.1 hypothetical protein [Falsarthrobacter nasiphocae]
MRTQVGGLVFHGAAFLLPGAGLDRRRAGRGEIEAWASEVLGRPVRLSTVCPACGSVAHGQPRLELDPRGEPSPASRAGGDLARISYARASLDGGGLAIAAVVVLSAGGGPLPEWARVGVDLEARGRKGAPHPRGWGEYALTPAERGRVAASADPEAASLRVWTQKEALAKLTGRGLEIEPQALDTALVQPPDTH